jgi:hypothetical protein
VFPFELVVRNKRKQAGFSLLILFCLALQLFLPIFGSFTTKLRKQHDFTRKMDEEEQRMELALNSDLRLTLLNCWEKSLL